MSGCVNRSYTLKNHGSHKSRKSQLACLVAAIDKIPFVDAYRDVSESWDTYFAVVPAGWVRRADRALLKFNDVAPIRRHHDRTVGRV